MFITGTDTGVGKTMVAAGLVRLARDRGIRCVAVKPIETGCPVREGKLYPEDGVFLQLAAQGALTLDQCAPVRLSVPASPARAAAMEGRRLNLSDLEEHIRTIAEDADLTIVEGAGGLMVPIQGKLMMIDLIERLGYPTLLVGRTRLGTLNHTLLSLEALQRRGIETAGIVLSTTEPIPGPEEEFTAGDLAGIVKDVPVAVLPHLEEGIRRSPEEIANTMARIWPSAFVAKCLGQQE
ncbi:MAG: dethiobiotin synthase [Desulfomonile tiedjei]|nr:dethiobiotin synthase [Desulfomonile tiedjei]